MADVKVYEATATGAIGATFNAKEVDASTDAIKAGAANVSVVNVSGIAIAIGDRGIVGLDADGTLFFYRKISGPTVPLVPAKHRYNPGDYSGSPSDTWIDSVGVDDIVVVGSGTDPVFVVGGPIEVRGKTLREVFDGIDSGDFTLYLKIKLVSAFALRVTQSGSDTEISWNGISEVLEMIKGATPAPNKNTFIPSLPSAIVKMAVGFYAVDSYIFIDGQSSPTLVGGGIDFAFLVATQIDLDISADYHRFIIYEEKHNQAQAQSVLDTL